MTRHIDYRNTLYEHCKRDGPSHHSRSNVKQIQRGENLINTTLENWSAVTHPITLVHCSPGPPSTTGMTLYIKIPLRLKRPKIKKGPDREGGAQESNSRSWGHRVWEKGTGRYQRTLALAQSFRGSGVGLVYYLAY